MNVLLIGSGGREHALAWKIAASPLLKAFYCVPGNPGISEHATCIELDVDDQDAIIALCREKEITLIVVGPEAPLVAGLADKLEMAGYPVFGPSAAAAQLEGSKGFTKDLCDRFSIPTGAYMRLNNAPKAKAYARQMGAPIVIKADGLAAGKGVTVAHSLDEAYAAIDDCFEGAFGDAGAEVVVEEFLAGEEASFFCLCDGTQALPLGTAQDHKAVGDGDTGPNTGGMGAYSPAPVMTDELVQRTMNDIIKPTLAGMVEMGMPFRGVLYAGLMITDSGPQLIEYNVRFGDPECQPLMMRLKDDILMLMKAAVDGQLWTMTARWKEETALCVVMAADGYPGSYKKGTPIGNLDQASAEEGVEIFHAGTKSTDTGLVANGGRVLGITALGSSARKAQQKAYRAVDLIDWDDGFCRWDIGWRAVARES